MYVFDNLLDCYDLYCCCIFTAVLSMKICECIYVAQMKIMSFIFDFSNVHI
jgi:hypothetical protein